MAEKVRKDIAKHNKLPNGSIVHECERSYFVVTIPGEPWTKVSPMDSSSLRSIGITVFSKFNNFCVAVRPISPEFSAECSSIYCKNLDEVISMLIRFTNSSILDIINENADSDSDSDLDSYIVEEVD